MPDSIPCYFYFHGSAARGGFVQRADDATKVRAVITSAPDAEQRLLLEEAVKNNAPVLAEEIISGSHWRLGALGEWVKQ